MMTGVEVGQKTGMDVYLLLYYGQIVSATVLALNTQAADQELDGNVQIAHELIAKGPWEHRQLQ